MAMIKAIKKYFSRFRAVILLDGEPYLVRYRIWQGKKLGIYIHHILTSDRDRNLHDHPFDFTTWILWGGYWEHTGHRYTYLEDGAWIDAINYRNAWKRPGTRIKHKAEDLHRIQLETKNGKARPCWSLFIRGPKRRSWGFQTPKGWVDWREYEDLGEMKGRAT